MADNMIPPKETGGELPQGYTWPLSPEVRRQNADWARLMLALTGIRSDLTPIDQGDLAGMRGEITRLLKHLDAADLLAVDLLVMRLAATGPAEGWRERLRAREIMR